MRKNLHYKVLASVLAIAGLYFYNAPAAWAEMQKVQEDINEIWVGNGEVNGNYQIPDNAEVYGWYNQYPTYGNSTNKANKNQITINNSTLTKVSGGFTVSIDQTDYSANNNTVTITDSCIQAVYGGESNNGIAYNNNVLIKGSKNEFDIVAGGTTSIGKAIGNTVTINGNVTANSFIAGGAGNRSSIISNNHVIIEGGTVIGNIYGGYNRQDAYADSITDNDITIKGSANVEAANLYGGFANYLSDNAVNNNKLIIIGWNGNVNSVQNFSAIDFEEVNWKNGGTVLNITKSPANALANTKLNLISFAGGTTINKDESMTFVTSENKVNLGITEANLNVDSGFFAGVTVYGDGQFAVDDKGNITYTVQKVKTNKQIDLVAENRAVAAAFINQGTDLISDSLDTLSRDGTYGVKTFAAVHGNRSKYDVNSDLKINGWSTIVGVGNAAEFTNGDEFSWGVFYENGSGNYRTYNEFNNEFFRGDGSLVYNGGGIAARYENNNGVYTEGSLRAGMLKSDMDNALRDGSGNYYGYDSESAYYGAHIGVGKIISLSDSSDLDVYGKFFHTYTEGDSFTVANDKFEFDSITSDRLRLGARITTNKANAFSTYYGLAYEYEFNGDADMRAQNLAAPTQSLQGSSYMAEVGFNYQPTPDSPWSFDLNLRGYAGEREGGSFNVQATYTF